MKNFNWIIAGILMLAVIILGTAGLSLNRAEKSFQSRIKAYGFLSNYVCWEDAFEVTLYTTDPKECSKNKNHPFFGIMQSGVRAVPYRSMAVDPKVVPLGSILIDAETGYVFIAEDTGNMVQGRHVDLFIGQSTVKNNELMSKWGGKRRQFFIIETRNANIYQFPFKV